MKYTIKTLLLGALFSIMLASNQSYAGNQLGNHFSVRTYKRETVSNEVLNGTQSRTRYEKVNSSTGRVVESYWQDITYTAHEASPTNCPNANCQNPPTDSQQQVLDQVTNQPSLTTDIVNQLPID
jgi:hypothetical protein